MTSPTPKDQHDKAEEYTHVPIRDVLEAIAGPVGRAKVRHPDDEALKKLSDYCDRLFQAALSKTAQPCEGGEAVVDLFAPSLEAAEAVFQLIKPENEFRSMCRHTAAKTVEIIFTRALTRQPEPRKVDVKEIKSRFRHRHGHFTRNEMYRCLEAIDYLHAQGHLSPAAPTPPLDALERARDALQYWQECRDNFGKSQNRTEYDQAALDVVTGHSKTIRALLDSAIAAHNK